MISNITNLFPSLLKKMKDHEEANSGNLKFSLVETMKFYESILPKTKSMACLKHLYIDCIFKLKAEYADALKNFVLTIDSLPFVNSFTYDITSIENGLIIRSNYEELAILSLILIGSIKSLSKEATIKNKSIFISLAFHFLKFCVNNGYNVCKNEDIKVLEDYNDLDKDAFEYVALGPTPEKYFGTIHFIGVDLNKDILCIFENYKNVKFTFNEESSSFIITMSSSDWDDYWKKAPQYLKDEYVANDDKKVDIR